MILTFRYKWCHVTIVLLSSLAVIESTRPPFREDYRYEKVFNAFYKVHNIAVNWFQARIRCEGEGAELIVPENLDEADVLPLLISTIRNRYDGIFVGINDLYFHRIFVTVKGYEIHDSILNLLWEYGQPKVNAGRCIAMHHNGRLYVQRCTTSLPFICKVKAADVKYHEECETFDTRWTLGPNATCYLHHIEPQTWHDAFATCVSAGGNLAVMNSRTEAEFARGMFKKVTERRLPDNDFAFIGFHDLFHRHQYRTVHGDSLARCGFTDWSLSCGKTPNSTNERRCGGLRRSGLLAVSDCNTPAMFICEKKLSKEAESSTETDEVAFKNALRMDHLKYLEKEPPIHRSKTTITLPATTNVGYVSEVAISSDVTTIKNKKKNIEVATQFEPFELELKTTVDFPLRMKMEDKLKSPEAQAVTIMLSSDVATSRESNSNVSVPLDVADQNNYW